MPRFGAAFTPHCCVLLVCDALLLCGLPLPLPFQSFWSDMPFSSAGASRLPSLNLSLLWISQAAPVQSLQHMDECFELVASRLRVTGLQCCGAQGMLLGRVQNLCESSYRIGPFLQSLCTASRQRVLPSPATQSCDLQRNPRAALWSRSLMILNPPGDFLWEI
jgi:hypothetical protein